MCIGIDHCSKKSCLENERCVVNAEPKFKTTCEVRRGPRKKNKPKTIEQKNNACQVDKKYCSNERACEILGQCILKHPLVKKDKMALKQLKGPKEISTIVKIIARLMPSLNKPGKKNKCQK